MDQQCVAGAFWFGEKSWFGVSLFASNPLQSSLVHFFTTPWRAHLPSLYHSYPFPADLGGSGRVELISAQWHAFPHTTVSQWTVKDHAALLSSERNWDITKVSTVSYDKSSIPLPRPVHTGAKTLDWAQTLNSQGNSQCPSVSPWHGTWTLDEEPPQWMVFSKNGRRNRSLFLINKFLKIFYQGKKICWKIYCIFSNSICLVNIFRDPGRWVIYFQVKSIISTHRAFVSVPGALCYLFDILHLF